MIECETLDTIGAEETTYITITREEYDELRKSRVKLDTLISAIKADVLPVTLRRIVRQEEAAYKAGAAIGDFLRSFSQGMNDGSRPEKMVRPENTPDARTGEAATRPAEGCPPRNAGRSGTGLTGAADIAAPASPSKRCRLTI